MSSYSLLVFDEAADRRMHKHLAPAHQSLRSISVFDTQQLHPESSLLKCLQDLTVNASLHAGQPHNFHLRPRSDATYTSINVVARPRAPVLRRTVHLPQPAHTHSLAEVDMASDSRSTGVEPILVLRRQLLVVTGLDGVDPTIVNPLYVSLVCPPCTIKTRRLGHSMGLFLCAGCDEPRDWKTTLSLEGRGGQSAVDCIQR